MKLLRDLLEITQQVQIEYDPLPVMSREEILNRKIKHTENPEVFAGIPIKNTSAISMRHLHNVLKVEKSNYLGGGAYATAIRTTNPHIIRKIGKTERHPQDDGYLQFLEAILKHQDNPYFPRIYKIKIFRSKNMENSFKEPFIYWFMVDMERLRPINELNIEQIDSVMERTFGRETTPFEKARIKNGRYGEIFGAIERAVWDLTGDNPDTIIDPTLHEVINILRDITKRKYISVDIHDYNIMFRLLPSGAQLVITDPFI